MLILAATPIGNLSDASPRLRELLAESKFIAAEDTRSLLQLANALGIQMQAKLFSLHEHNELHRNSALVELALDDDLVLVSDAGMPTVSDPGFVLVRSVAAAGGTVTVVPGPSAVISALAVSGLPTDRFTFEGFLPRKSGERQNVFAELLQERRTMIFFESPHRLLDALIDAVAVFGPDRLAAVSRELTKKFEETKRGSLAELADWARTEPKGEMVLIIGGAEEKTVNLEQLIEQVNQLVASGNRLKEAVIEIADANDFSKKLLYDAVLSARK